MTPRIPMLGCAILLLALIGCGPSTPATGGGPANTPSGDGGTPSADGNEKQLTALAQKYSALHSTESIFGGEKAAGWYMSFRPNAVPDDAKLAELAKDLSGVEQPVLLDLQECKQLTAAGLAPLAETKCVSGLYLKGAKLKELLPTVAKAKQLRYLQLVDNTLEDADLAPLAALVNLRGLVVIGALRAVTSATYQHLAGMTELEILAGSLNPSVLTFNDADLAHVTKLAKLKKFTVRIERGEKLSDKGLANLKGMTGLEELEVGLTPDTTAESLAVIGGLKNLRKLELSAVNSTQWPPAGVDKLLPLAGQLKFFKLNRSSFSAPAAKPPADKAWLGTVAKFTGLEMLELMGTGLDDKDLTQLAGLTQLWFLDLGDSPITGPGLAHLKPLTKLKSLQLQGTALTDASAAEIKGLPASVTSINVRSTKLTEPVLNDLEKSRKWESFLR